MRLKEVTFHGGGRYGWEHWCPGCNERHAIPTSGNDPWSFNGDVERPTFQPSVLHSWEHGEKREPRRCHYFITDGNILFCVDSTHALAGESVPLPEIP